MPSFKPAMLVQGTWSYNALRFATWHEANRSASELFSRWTQPSAYEAHPSDDEPNYYWHAPSYKACSLPRSAEHQAEYEACALAVCEAFSALGEVYRQTCNAREHAKRELAAEHYGPSFLVPFEREVSVSRLPATVQRGLRDAGYLFRVVRLTAGHNTVNIPQGSSIVVPNPKTSATSFTAGLAQPTVALIPSGGCVIVGSGRNMVVNVRQVDVLGWLSPGHTTLEIIADARQEYRLAEMWEMCGEALGSIVEVIHPIQHEILSAFVFESGAKRKRRLATIATPYEVNIATEFLVTEGLLKRNTKGATSITDSGKAKVQDDSIVRYGLSLVSKVA